MSRADHRRRTGGRTRFRPLLAALAGATLVAIGLMPVESAVADPVSSCSTSRGVLVVVDFRHFGASITRGCDATPSTGYDALHAAGFTTAGTHHDGPGFICRIDGHPSVGQDPCFNTPPATAYWSYWHANAGQTSWSYSTNGAQSYSPQPGSIDAWVFGGTSPPSFSPAVARGATAPVTKPVPKPTPHRSTTSHPARHGAATTARSRQHGGRQPSSTSVQRSSAHARASTTADRSSATSGSSSRAPTSTSASGSRAIAVAAGAGAPTIVDASTTAAAAQHSSSGSVWPAVLGLVLAVALAAGAGWTVLRRRRAAP